MLASCHTPTSEAISDRSEVVSPAEPQNPVSEKPHERPPKNEGTPATSSYRPRHAVSEGVAPKECLISQSVIRQRI
jgi:hypothetical protein